MTDETEDINSRCERPNVIFIHVPKNAGYAIKHAVRDWRFMHATTSDTRELVGHEVYDNGIKFAVVRHPCSRLVSYYHWILEKKSSRDPYWRSEGKEKVELVRSFRSFDRFVASNPPDVLNSPRFLDSQLRYLLRYGVLDVDDLLLFEDLESDFRDFCEKHRIEHRPLQLVNSSTHQPWRAYYRTETYHKVLRAYASDYKLWQRVAGPERVIRFDGLGAGP